MWGKGIYFAVDAKYSCPGYSFCRDKEQKKYEVFLANVIIGRDVDLKPDSGLREPPLIIPGTNQRYDSVKGHTNGSDVYMVY
jgi:hypothetical protein